MDNVIVAYKQFTAKCRHERISISESTSTVTCVTCGQSINPIWALKRLSEKESHYHETIKTLEQRVKKTKAKLDK